MNNLISTKIKFIRNLKGYNFQSNISSDAQNQITNICFKALESCNLKPVGLIEMNKKVIDTLLSQDLIEYEFVNNYSNQGVANIDNITIQINGKNHVEILSKNGDILDAYSNAKNIDKKLCTKLNFAYSDKYGFLSPDIKNIGSGISIESKVILPALAHEGVIDKLPNVNDKLAFNIQCIDYKSGLCIITTGATLGYTEKQVCERVQDYINKLVQLEIKTCNDMLSRDKDDMLDKLYRAKAILSSCVKLDCQEAYLLLGHILMGINSGVESCVKVEAINKAIDCINLYKNQPKTLAKTIKDLIILK